ncbi:MAG: hypothetical protein EAX95_13430 [Candidatus Thorarchaeota archaeon]|nr:hypothetical protein [Candidatus Thorarchaeota archaeon]
MSSSKKSRLRVLDAEQTAIQELRDVAWNLNSADMQEMYTAAGLLTQFDVNRTILPQVMDLLDADDMFVRKIVFRSAGRNVFGEYIQEFFFALKGLPPAEAMQVLQSIREAFRVHGSPTPTSEQKRWVHALSGLGKEHQPAVFDLMTALGRPGEKWVARFLKENIQSVTIGAIASFAEFPEQSRTRLVRLLIEQASKRKRELLAYVGGIVEAKTVRYLKSFLRSGDWEERKEVATTIGRVGIATASDIVRDVIADPDWRVKQALIESIDVSRSKFAPLRSILEILVTDSHTRVRGSAERLVLRLGAEECSDSKLSTQRERIMKQFRKQLLRAAPANKDVDSTWIGIEVSSAVPIPLISSEEFDGDDSAPQPVGMGDLQAGEETSGEEVAEEPSTINLREALLKRMKESIAEIEPAEDTSFLSELEEIAVDKDLPPTAKVLSLMDRLARKVGKAIPISSLREHASDMEMSVEEMDGGIEKLVKEGTIYMVDEETVRRTDIQTD